MEFAMSFLGQTRRLDRAPLTSGLPLQQTFSRSVGMSQKCQYRKWRGRLHTLLQRAIEPEAGGQY
jgi:hypothetical protein